MGSHGILSSIDGIILKEKIMSKFRVGDVAVFIRDSIEYKTGTEVMITDVTELGNVRVKPVSTNDSSAPYLFDPRSLELKQRKDPTKFMILSSDGHTRLFYDSYNEALKDSQSLIDQGRFDDINSFYILKIMAEVSIEKIPVIKMKECS